MRAFTVGEAEQAYTEGKKKWETIVNIINDL